MRIEIDQSGKIEFTNKITVIGYSNKDSKTVIILSREKQKLQKHFRQDNKPRQYVCTIFAFLIFFLIREKRTIEQIIIDTEYPGQEALIKSHLLTFLRKNKIHIDKKSIHFQRIGKKSRAHQLVYQSYKQRKADIKISARDIIRFLSK